MGGYLSFFWRGRRGRRMRRRRRSCFQVSAGFHKRSDQHVSVAVTQREARGEEGPATASNPVNL